MQFTLTYIKSDFKTMVLIKHKISFSQKGLTTFITNLLDIIFSYYTILII